MSSTSAVATSIQDVSAAEIAGAGAGACAKAGAATLITARTAPPVAAALLFQATVPLLVLRVPTQRRVTLDVALAGPDVIALGHVLHEHAAVADLARPRGRHDRPHDLVGLGVRHDDFDFDLRQQRDVVFLSAIHGGVALLPAVAAYFGHGHPWDARLFQGLADLVHFVGANDAFDELHGLASSRTEPARPFRRISA